MNKDLLEIKLDALKAKKKLIDESIEELIVNRISEICIKTGFSFYTGMGVWRFEGIYSSVIDGAISKKKASRKYEAIEAFYIMEEIKDLMSICGKHGIRLYDIDYDVTSDKWKIQKKLDEMLSVCTYRGHYLFSGQIVEYCNGRELLAATKEIQKRGGGDAFELEDVEDCLEYIDDYCLDMNVKMFYKDKEVIG